MNMITRGLDQTNPWYSREVSFFTIPFPFSLNLYTLHSAFGSMHGAHGFTSSMSPDLTLCTFTINFFLARRLFQGTGTERNDIPLLFDTQPQCTRKIYMINDRMADGLGARKRDRIPESMHEK
jgi:hypothetical protein